MGNEQTTDFRVKDEYTFWKELNDQVYGKVKVFKNVKADQYYALKSFTFKNKNDYKKSLIFFEQVYSNQIQKEIKILEIQKKEFDKIFLTIEFHQKSLEQEYEKRKKDKQYFLESEVIDVMLTVIQSFKNQAYNDNIQLSLSKVLVSNNGMKFGNLKLLHQMQDYERLLIGAIPEKDLLLSPEALNSLGQRIYKQKQYAQCLDPASTKRNPEFLVWDFYPFNYAAQKIRMRRMCMTQKKRKSTVRNCSNTIFWQKKILTKYFEGQLCSIIKQMIEIDPQKRLNQNQVIEELLAIQPKKIEKFQRVVSSSRVRAKWKVPPLETFDNKNNKNSLSSSKIKAPLFSSTKKEVKENKEIYHQLKDSRGSQLSNEEIYKSESKALIQKMDQALLESQRILERYQNESQKGLNYYNENKIKLPSWKKKKNNLLKNKKYT